jgi:hypothetical protein
MQRLLGHSRRWLRTAPIDQGSVFCPTAWFPRAVTGRSNQAFARRDGHARSSPTHRSRL